MSYSEITDPSYIRECEILRAHSEASLWSEHIHGRGIITEANGIPVSNDEANRRRREAGETLAALMQRFA